MIQKIESFATQVPRVLVSGSFNSDFATPELNNALKTLADNTLSQLALAGLEGVIVNAAASNESPQELVNTFDGLIILGGGDIHPEIYGQCIENACSYGMNPRADDFEISLVRSAVQAKVPLIGICRGMQVFNIALGGTLIQDIGLDTVHKVADDNTAMTEHSVRILSDTKLAAIFGEGQIDIRSAHHQAAEKLGNGLSVSAVAPDGIVEAIELNGDAWGIGLQWHPEDSLADTTQIEMLFKAFAQQCAAHVKRRISVPTN